MQQPADPKFIATLDYLRRLCSQREYCRRDVYDKAYKRLEDAALASEAVDALIQEGFVDQRRYAAAFARDKASIRGWGPLKIKTALAAKGVPAETINAALEDIDEAKADEKLRKAVQTKARQLSGDPQIRLKLLRFALGRGYSYDVVNSVVQDILNKDF